MATFSHTGEEIQEERVSQFYGASQVLHGGGNLAQSSAH
jgi:hypothetical protein